MSNEPVVKFGMMKLILLSAAILGAAAVGIKLLNWLIGVS
jgi:hypothetical protein